MGRFVERLKMALAGSLTEVKSTRLTISFTFLRSLILMVSNMTAANLIGMRLLTLNGETFLERLMVVLVGSPTEVKSTRLTISLNLKGSARLRKYLHGLNHKDSKMMVQVLFGVLLQTPNLDRFVERLKMALAGSLMVERSTRPTISST